MAAPMWRMNGVWKRMAGVLLLCTLLLCNEVTCQDDAPANNTDATLDLGDPAADSDAATSPVVDVASAASVTVATGETLVSSPELSFTPAHTDQSGPTPATTAVPGLVPVAAGVPGVSSGSDPFIELSCVEPDEVKKLQHVLVVVETADCEETKLVIQDHPDIWCKEQNCDLKLHQNGKNLYAGSEDVTLNTLKSMFESDPLKEKLTRSPSSPSSSSDSSVFAGVLGSGLLAALALTVGYFKCQRRSEGKVVRLAEEAYPVDQDNQGNTLVSVAPLSQPTETPEKPSVNGESPEAVKTEPAPPTNGHSTTNTADTEM